MKHLEDLTVKELRQAAKELNVKGRSKMNKAELIEALKTREPKKEKTEVTKNESEEHSSENEEENKNKEQIKKMKIEFKQIKKVTEKKRTNVFQSYYQDD